MANKKLKTIQFPSLPDTYTVPQVENGTNNNVAALDGAGNVKDSAIEVSKVAKTDGSYQNLNAGTSDQLNATVGVIDKVPYNFRTSGGSVDIGNRQNDKLVGGTIVWNQLLDKSKYPATTTINGVTFTNNGDGTITVNGIATANAILAPISQANPIPIASEHKFLFISCPSGGNLNTYFSDLKTVPEDMSFYDLGGGALIATTSTTTCFRYNIRVMSGYTANNLVFKPQLFDLTQMFGSTIADYIYSLEQATKGTGVAWFKKLFPKPYYAYNAGELMSVCTNAHITRGFNAYNHANGTAKLVGGKQYQITGAYTSLVYSTGETISPNESGLFTPMKNGVLTITGGNATNTCVHLVWSGYRNGEYEPYVEHLYPLSPVELRGIPKLDSANNLYFDGDTYEKDGTVTRRYGIVDLGTLNWDSNLGQYPSKSFYSDIFANVKKPTYDVVSNGKFYNLYISENGRLIAVTASTEVYNSSEAFKAALSGVYLVYELETPTTETTNPFADPQIVNDFGTEEYVDALATAETSPRDVEVPVGHETFYQANLRDKLQNLPANANADGLYLVKQTGNKQELIAYTAEDELPASPAETGTYVLKLVDGTLTWVLES